MTLKTLPFRRPQHSTTNTQARDAEFERILRLASAVQAASSPSGDAQTARRLAKPLDR
jgi:hypothetical protein